MLMNYDSHTFEENVCKFSFDIETVSEVDVQKR